MAHGKKHAAPLSRLDQDDGFGGPPELIIRKHRHDWRNRTAGRWFVSRSEYHIEWHVERRVGGVELRDVGDAQVLIDDDHLIADRNTLPGTAQKKAHDRHTIMFRVAIIEGNPEIVSLATHGDIINADVGFVDQAIQGGGSIENFIPVRGHRDRSEVGAIDQNDVVPRSCFEEKTRIVSSPCHIRNLEEIVPIRADPVDLVWGKLPMRGRRQGEIYYELSR